MLKCFRQAVVQVMMAIVLVLVVSRAVQAADVTFFVCSDTHYRATAEENKAQTAGVELINTLPGTAYPGALGGGTVDAPRGVLVLGDLINDGAVEGANHTQWGLWKQDFGVNGEGRVKFPVYEGFGNHDLHPSRFIQKEIIARNQKRPGLTAISANGLHYSWDWEGVHFVQLNLHPGQEWSPRRHYGPVHDPEYSFAFLVEDLKQNAGNSGRPVVLMHHYDVRDDNDWWLHEEIAAYYNAIKNYNVVLILHGHTGTGIYKWNGFDVVNTGNLPGGGVFVCRITPDNRLIVAQRTPDRQWMWTMEKKISLSSARRSTARPSADDRSRVAADADPDNITFLVVSDTHYRIDTLHENTRNVRAMNAVAGTPYPDGLGLQRVATPLGVIHCGDCTNDARQWQWDTFVSDYGLTGTEGLLAYPVYEICGNHDGSRGSPVGDGIVERNRRRPGLAGLSDNGLHYSWDWGAIHFVSLGTRPGTEAHPYNPHHSLDFLKADLEKHIGNTGKAVVLFHHFGFDAAHSMNWWTDEERDKYLEAIRDYNVIGIFHGHSHVCDIYTWNGIDIFNAPHMRWDPAREGFLVVNITPQTMTVVERKADGTWGLQKQKKIYRSYEEGRVAAVVNNAQGATEITGTTARLNGRLSFVAADAGETDLRIYWGPSDGGTDKQKWAHEELIGSASAGSFSHDLEDLTVATTYYYRSHATNASGEDWADASCEFRTRSAAYLDNAEGATDVSMSAAVLHGNLTAASMAPTYVSVCWDVEDRGRQRQAWSGKADVGPTAPGAFNVKVEGLKPDTVYYYRCYARNEHGEAFARTSASFRTEPAVVVDNGVGARRIRRTQALLSGNLSIANLAPTSCFVYWGDNDGGTDPADWDHKLAVGQRSLGGFTAPVDGLTPETSYYYRCYASNAAGESWAPSTEVFSTAADFTEFPHAMKITFPGYTRPETLRSFPVLVVLSETVPNFKYSQFASSDGSDLRFADANDVQLSYEVERWDPQGDSYIWVKVPELTGGKTAIHAYWGNPEAAKSPTDARTVSTWSNGYAGVWHLERPEAVDSLNENAGRSKGSAAVRGVVGDAQQFSGSADDVIVVERVTPRLEIEGPVSLSAWVRPLSANAMVGIVTKGSGWGDFNLHLKAGSIRPSFELKPFLPDAAKAPVAKTSLQPQTWYHLCGTWDGTTARLYVNGIEEAAASAEGDINTSSRILRIGAIENRFGPCQIDEVRISNVGRSADWVWACWQNQARPSEFCAYAVR